MTRKATYSTWYSMKRRCFCPTEPSYKHYGGRGITVCKRWAESFEAFLEDMGERPDGMSIDRINNDGNYEPGNCRWATPQQQRINQRNTVHWLEFNGKSMPLRYWASEIGMKEECLLGRLRRGMDVAAAIVTPVKEPGPPRTLPTGIFERKGRFQAYVYPRYSKRYIGTFATLEEALHAQLQAGIA